VPFDSVAWLVQCELASGAPPAFGVVPGHETGMLNGGSASIPSEPGNGPFAQRRHAGFWPVRGPAVLTTIEELRLDSEALRDMQIPEINGFGGAPPARSVA